MQFSQLSAYVGSWLALSHELLPGRVSGRPGPGQFDRPMLLLLYHNEQPLGAFLHFPLVKKAGKSVKNREKCKKPVKRLVED